MMLKVRALDAPPPPFADAGLKAVTCALPTVAMSEAGICALSCVALINSVGRFAPFQRTVAPLTKFVPLTASVKAAPPAFAALGFKLVNTGTGFGS